MPHNHYILSMMIILNMLLMLDMMIVKRGMVVIVVMILMNIMLMVKVKMTMLLFSSCLLRHSPPFPRPVATQVYLSLPKYTPNSAVPPFLSPIPISHYQFSSPIGNFPISHSYRPLPSLRAYFLLAIAIAMANSPLPVADQKFTSHRYGVILLWICHPPEEVSGTNSSQLCVLHSALVRKEVNVIRGGGREDT